MTPRTRRLARKGYIAWRYEGWFLFGFIPLYIRRYGVV